MPCTRTSIAQVAGRPLMAEKHAFVLTDSRCGRRRPSCSTRALHAAASALEPNPVSSREEHAGRRAVCAGAPTGRGAINKQCTRLCRRTCSRGNDVEGACKHVAWGAFGESLETRRERERESGKREQDILSSLAGQEGAWAHRWPWQQRQQRKHLVGGRAGPLVGGGTLWTNSSWPGNVQGGCALN